MTPLVIFGAGLQSQVVVDLVRVTSRSNCEKWNASIA